ncbi:hypothetical protein PSYPI_02657 [Pseudomonas syringae pv. pisi str. 1704B]|uniref:Uncharacterized protein n=2 Tax=Pseudomonas syringae TaxID=317 RepID=F3G2S3_PSESJ|nr:hypothetical protein PSYJA_14607 [Pseudomonas syringae pv. japonica str. M301072]EGH41373.1 hypothetical protein PSYPI_02657 [Pseudomonas syringae pv. pisi str. 1704B]
MMAKLLVMMALQADIAVPFRATAILFVTKIR